MSDPEKKVVEQALNRENLESLAVDMTEEQFQALLESYGELAQKYGTFQAFFDQGLHKGEGITPEEALFKADRLLKIIKDGYARGERAQS